MAQPARAEDLDEAAAAWLVASGRDAVAASTASLDAGASELAVGQRLRDGGLDAARASAVMGASLARRRARLRWRDADRLLLTPSGLEQASDPAVAAWRARRFAQADLTVDAGCGVGGDLLALANCGAGCVVGVDRDTGRLHLARANVEALGLGEHTHVVAGDALALPVRGGLVHADPGRRVAGHRVRHLADTTPPVGRVLAIAASGHGVVVGPAVDLGDPDLPADVEIEFVQVGPRLIEAVVWRGELKAPGAVATATVLADSAAVGVGEYAVAATRTRRTGTVRQAAGTTPHPRPLGSHLIVPAPALVRARLHDEVAHEIGAGRVAIHRALLTTDDAPAQSPWWHAWEIEAVLPARPKAVRRWLATAPRAPLEIELHGPDLSIEPWWSGLRGVDRGPQGRRLHVIRLDDRAVAVATRPAPAASDSPGAAPR